MSTTETHDGMSMISTRTQPFVRRVLMTVDMAGGGWDFAITLAQALERYGLEIGLATLGARPDSKQRAQVRNSMQIDLFEGKYKVEWMNNPWRDIQLAENWLLGLEKRFKPDLVHLNHLAHGAIDWQTPVLTAAHNCACAAFEALHGKAAPADYDRYRSEVRAGLKHSAEVVAPTMSALLNLKKNYGITRGRVITTGCSGINLTSHTKKAIIFTSGNAWDETKNFKALSIAAKGLEWPVVAAGEVEHPETKHVSRFHDIDLLGPLPRSEVSEWMKEACIFVAPSFCEPYGMHIIDAARAGCILVLGDNPSMREVWGHAALYVDPTRPQALHECLQRLIRQPELRAEFAARARLRAAQSQFFPETMAVNYLHLYNNMLRQHRVPFAHTVDTEARPIRRRRKASRAIVKATY